jgi:hypothetical protein
MFFNKLDERNTIVQCILTFEKIEKVGLANLGSDSSRASLLKSHFLRWGFKCDDPSMLSCRFDDKNMMVKSIMYFV